MNLLTERRLSKLHDQYYNSTDSRRKELLSMLLAIITPKQIKIAFEELGLKLEKKH